MEAHKLWSRKAELEAMGVRLACIVKEAIPEQINEFVPTYWGEEDLYLDEGKEFFMALGGGQVKKKGIMALVSSDVRAANSKAGSYLKSIGGTSNLSGEGWILGGLYVVRAGGEIVFQHRESTFGDIAEVDDILEAARSAVAVDKGGDSQLSTPPRSVAVAAV